MTARLKDLAKKVRMTAEYGARLDYDQRDDWQKTATDWRCTLRYRGRRYSFDFFQGPAICREPDVEGCLDCLLSDASAGEQSFEEFCSEFGYDPDSRKAERIHKACVKVAQGLRRMLGDDFETFVYAERD